MRVGVERAEVALQRVPAEQANGSQPERLAEVAEHGQHLLRELARGYEHQRLHLGVARVEPLRHRDPEGERLAGARLCDADAVPALEQQRDRPCLHWRRFGEAHGGDDGERAIGDPQRAELLRIVARIDVEPWGRLGLRPPARLSGSWLFRGVGVRLRLRGGRRGAVAVLFRPAAAPPAPAAASATAPLRRVRVGPGLGVRSGVVGASLGALGCPVVGGLAAQLVVVIVVVLERGRVVAIVVFAAHRQVAQPAHPHPPGRARAGGRTAPARQDRPVPALGGRSEGNVLGQRRVEVGARARVAVAPARSTFAGGAIVGAPAVAALGAVGLGLGGRSRVVRSCSRGLGRGSSSRLSFGSAGRRRLGGARVRVRHACHGGAVMVARGRAQSLLPARPERRAAHECGRVASRAHLDRGREGALRGGVCTRRALRKS